MIQIEVACCNSRVLHFVVAFRLETDRIGVNSFTGHPRKHSRYGGAVGTAAQETCGCRYRRFGRDRAFDERDELVESALQIAIVVFRERWDPIRTCASRVSVDDHSMSGLDAPNLRKNCLRR